MIWKQYTKSRGGRRATMIIIKCCANCGYNKDDKCTSRDTLITTVIADDWCPEWREMEEQDDRA